MVQNPFNGIESLSGVDCYVGCHVRIRSMELKESKIFYVDRGANECYQESIQWNWKLIAASINFLASSSLNPFNGIESATHQP